ncbi:MAG: TIGR01212 family radical SAM protein [Bacteroidales bacterium]|nr:TIGR01212 family radical SAM protein [Bacteroidales bacterium]
MNKKLQKIMIDAGFTCPNRDGKVGHGGCTFCRTESFSPAYCQGSIAAQIEAGKKFFAGKYPDMKYLAYFQAFSNTYAPLETLKQRYSEALACNDVVGLVIGTRPDCLPNEVVHYLAELNQTTSVMVEIGVESFYDKTLQRINRGHTSAQSIDAIERCAAAGLPVCIHLIVGLPGESEAEILSEAEIINHLPVSSLKLHQLQILKQTAMAHDWELHRADFLDLSLDCYAQLVARFVRRLRPEVHVERFASSSPPSLLIAPRWGKKPSEVQKIIESYIINLKHNNK